MEKKSSSIESKSYRKWIVTAIKFVISFCILGYLFYQAYSNDQFSHFMAAEKRWGLLVCSLLITLLYNLISFARWWLLVSALNLPIRFMDAIRLGFISLLCTFLTIGIVGGDAVKAVYAARLTPGRRAEAIGSVLVDRMLGLFGLVCLASCAFLLSPSIRPSDATAEWSAIKTIGWFSVALMIAGIIGYSLLRIVPSIRQMSLLKGLESIPRVGGFVKQAFDSLSTYKSRIDIIVTCAVISLIVHLLISCSVYLTAAGLTDQPPTFQSHLISVPVANVANLIPLPAGLGAFEAALDFMYVGLSHHKIEPGFGLIVALSNRLIILTVASLGIYYYFAARREVGEVIHEAEEE